MKKTALTPDRLRVVTAVTTGVGVRFRSGAVTSDPLPVETSEVSSVSEMRRLEFALGRLAARDALADLGAAAVPVGIGVSGEPVWPEGVVGSISHTREIAIAVAGWSTDFLGVGVDIESEERRAGERTFRRICTPSEMEWVAAATDPDRRAMQIFCAKEATYKALSAIGGARLGFHDVEFAPEDSGKLAGRIRGSAAPDAPRRFTARTLIVDGFLVACVLVPRSAGSVRRIGDRE